MPISNIAAMLNNEPESAPWPAGYRSWSVCLSVGVCTSVCSPGCHSRTFIALIASTQQVINFKSGCFSEKTFVAE